MSLYSPPDTPPPQRRVKPLPKRQRTPPSASPPMVSQEYYLPILTNLLEGTRIEGGNAKKRKVPHAVGGETPGRVSRITAAGMHFKDTVRMRRKHLEGLIDGGEAEVVEKALMLGLLGTGDREGKRRRLSKRRVLRAARIKHKRVPLQGVENFQFTFHAPSKSTELLRQTKQEVDQLRKRLAIAPKHKPPAAPSAQKTLPPTPLPPTPASNKKKKKKRSALANASNPHHLRNYVPSRIPGTEQPSTGAVNNEFVPIRFLLAEIPPRRSSSKAAPPPTIPAQQGTNEWICAFCEYELFYGGEEEYRLAIRRRRKILKRRRRARERAARGVSGKRQVEKQDQQELNEEYGSEEDEFEDVVTGNRNGMGATHDVAREAGYG